MEKRKLLIADGNEELREALEAALQDEFCIRIANNGPEAMQLLDSFAPEVLVLDVVLSGVDGLRVLEYAAERGHKMKTLVATAACTEYVLGKLTQLAVGYVLKKPCQLKIAVERVREIAAEVVPVAALDEEQKLAQILLQLGINPKHNGYHYLCTAVKNCAQDSAQSLTKELYVTVGAVYGVSAQQVERSIRVAVEAAWKRRDARVWQQWFPGASAMKRPTNGEVICRLAEYLLLEKARKIG